MRILLDTNIILDFMLEREPFFNDANAIVQKIISRDVEGYVTATTLTNIFYIARKIKGIEIAKQYIADILALMRICPVNRRVLEEALSSNLRDFEDAVQLACANRLKISAIITRDRRDFEGAALPILSPSEFLEMLDEISEDLAE
ncbi:MULTISPECIES: type II toxin-antitoxin system VapC family toxin [Aerosakkonema]|uniref:type II toxin-antitoxin system VapC family toxin n=1 Tax=Aerosakkonema TaxID=1246629 RepID=UPI0035B8445A